MKNFLLSAAIAATLISSATFADSGSKLSAFDGIPSETVQAKELDAVSGKAAAVVGYQTIYQGQVVGSKTLQGLKNIVGNNQKALDNIYGVDRNNKPVAVDKAVANTTVKTAVVAPKTTTTTATPAKAGTCNGCTVTTGKGVTMPSTTALKTIFGYK